MKKKLLMVLIISGVMLASCTGKQGHKRMRIGDGTHFYCEPILFGDEILSVQHSTLSCPKINKGVMRDKHPKEELINLYCPECMTDELITIYIERYYPNKK